MALESPIVGQRVKSNVTGNYGTITSVSSEQTSKCMEHDAFHARFVVIAWDNGNKSYQPECDFDLIEYV